ncbi:ABC transporter G family member 31 [Phytophthora cinnamomi]|uniref:ABC transporter G family member 31 n=1 Tax=Phytophthora cinnamomi TaxID=4785 RepID=UPI00355A62BA|nr:ABC transporter G family member 31 [Phytophthora cinnamomi]
MVMSPNQGGLGSHHVDTARYLRFDGKNFLAYKEGLKAALKARKCWKILVGEETKTERDGSQEAARRRKKWKTKVVLLNDILTNTLDDGTRVRLAHLEKPQAKWSALVEDFEKKSFAVALFKRRELLNVEFDGDNESIRDYIHRVEAIRQELTLMGENVSDREVITALLTGLGDKYESMVETFDNLDDYTLQQVKVKLTSREERMKQAKSVSEARARKNAQPQSAAGYTPAPQQPHGESAFYAQGKKRRSGGGGDRCGQQKRRRTNIQCWNCGKWGHFERDCTAPKSDQSKKAKKGKGKQATKGQRNDDTHDGVPGHYNPYEEKSKGKPVHMIEVVKSYDELCYTNELSTIESADGLCLPFVLDNASSVNVCGCRDAFISMTEDTVTVMKWVEKSTTLKPKFKGLVRLVMTDAITRMKVPITIEALFVDGATNILSQRLMYVHHGFKSQTSDDQESITLTNSTMKYTWKFGIVNGLYQSVVEIPRSCKVMSVLQISTSTPSSSLKLWHLRLAHANWQAIREMETKGLVVGINLGREGQKAKGECYDCDIAKMKRMSFRKTAPKRTTVPFKKVYMDLGFIQVPTMEGYTVYLHLIDEGSRFQWYYGQQTKDETVDRLKDFRDLIKAKHQMLVSVFHSDQGTEFLNTTMAEQLAGESLQIFSHPHTPEEACLIEKAHGTLFKKVRAVLYSSVVKQYDFVTAFLNAPTDRVIFMEQPQGHVKRGYVDWRCFKDEALYWIRVESRLVLLPIYVDDILLIGCEQDVEFIARKLMARFNMKELGNVNYLLELQIAYDPERHVIFQQTKYAQDIMQKFRMDTAYPVHIPMTTDAVKLQPATEELATAIRILSKFLDKYSADPALLCDDVVKHLPPKLLETLVDVVRTLDQLADGAADFRRDQLGFLNDKSARYVELLKAVAAAVADYHADIVLQALKVLDEKSRSNPEFFTKA